MAQQVVVELIDDLDGTEAEHTVGFSFDGREYEIDLSAKNEAKLRKALEPFINAARRLGRTKTGRSARRGRPAVTPGASLADVRAWAREQGYQVSDRGRIAYEVRDAYDASH